MSTIDIQMFGRFAISANGQSFDFFSSQKAQELFCFLLLSHNQSHHREKLADMFWGERCVSESKKYFRKTLWQLQSALDQLPIPRFTELLSVESDWLQYNHNDEVCVDVLEFEDVYTTLAGRRGRELDQQGFRSAYRAANLYKGDLLEGCCQDWCIYERERLKDMFFVLIDKLMGYCEANCKYEAGINYGGRILAMDRAREITHLRLMRLYYLAGDRTGSIRQFETCRKILKDEFDIEPSKSTLDIYQRVIQSKSNHPEIHSNLSLSKAIPERANCIEELEKIKELVVMQESIQRQLLKKIHNLEEHLSHN